MIIPIALIVGTLLVLSLKLTGVPTKKSLACGLGVSIGILIVGYLIILVLVNSSWWTM